MKGPFKRNGSLLVVFLAAMLLSIVAVVCVSVYAEEPRWRAAPVQGATQARRPAVNIEGEAPRAPLVEGATGTHEVGAPVIDVKRDKEKTVYTIGSSDRRYEMEERDRAWDMLRNMTPIVDERHRRLPQNQPRQPAK